MKMDFDNDILVEYYNDVTEDIRYIRETVFVLEQGFSEEFDEIDKKSIHLLVKVNNKRAATARIFKSDNSNAKWTIGRFAVLKEYRGIGLGSFLLKKVEEKIKEQGGRTAELSAQKQAEKFYLSSGYIPMGDIYYDQHAPHIHMEKNTD